MAQMLLEASQEHPLLEAYRSLGRKMKVSQRLSLRVIVYDEALDVPWTSMEDERSEALRWDLVHCCLDLLAALMTRNKHSGVRQVDVPYVPTTSL